uniref:Uncharacterized protein n=1 Tax=Zea mays TaxID=4577 RepID=A0A804PRC8_MAIZE
MPHGADLATALHAARRRPTPGCAEPHSTPRTGPHGGALAGSLRSSSPPAEMVYGWNVPLRSTWKFFKQATIILSKSLQAGQASTVQLNQ